MKKIKKPIKFLISIVVCFLAGGIGSIFTSSSIPTWYASLIKPAFNPPNWLFGPVWTLLYLLMAVTLYLIWTGKKNVQASRWFYLQLMLNAAWSVIFFGLRQPLAAYVCIILLILGIIGTMFWTSKTTKTGMYLMIPYLLWVSFASVLNLMIVLLN